MMIQPYKWFVMAIVIPGRRITNIFELPAILEDGIPKKPYGAEFLPASTIHVFLSFHVIFVVCPLLK